MKNIIKLIALTLVFVFASCSDNSEEIIDKSISNLSLSGKVFGEYFKAVGGKAFESGNQISVNITNVSADCNSSIFDYKLAVSTIVNAELGTNNKANVVFDKEGETPLNMLNSTVIVEALTDSNITLKIKTASSISDDNKMEGVFTVPLCK